MIINKSEWKKIFKEDMLQKLNESKEEFKRYKSTKKVVYLQQAGNKLFSVVENYLMIKYNVRVVSYRELKNVVNDKDENQRFVRFHVEAIMRYVKTPISEEAQEDEALLSKQLASSIRANFIAEYNVINDMDIPEEALTEFGKYNAPYNIWPYWREYCQSTCSRMALPVIVIPLLRIPIDEKKKPPED